MRNDFILLTIIGLVVGFLMGGRVLSLYHSQDECSYEKLYMYAPETLYAPEPRLFSTELDYFRAAVQYADHGTWATLPDGTICTL